MSEVGENRERERSFLGVILREGRGDLFIYYGSLYYGFARNGNDKESWRRAGIGNAHMIQR